MDFVDPSFKKEDVSGSDATFVGLVNNGTTVTCNNHLDDITLPNILASGSYTAMCKMNVVSNPTGNSINLAIFGASNGTNQDGFELLVRKSDGALWWATEQNWAINLTGDTILSDQGMRWYTMAYDASTGLKVYLDTTETDTDAGTGATTYAENPQVFNRGDGLEANSSYGDVDYFLIWNRQLSAAEISEVQSDPSALFNGSSATRFPVFMRRRRKT